LPQDPYFTLNIKWSTQHSTKIVYHTKMTQTAHEIKQPLTAEQGKMTNWFLNSTAFFNVSCSSI